MLYKTIKFISYIVCILPNSIRNSFGNILGQLCWLIVPKKRKVMAINNAAQGLGITETEAMNTVKQSTVRFGRMILEILAFPRIKKDVNSHVQLKGKEHMHEALSHGRGVVLATAHSGNWELLGGTLALNGFPIVAVAQKQTNVDMDRLINEYRALVGMHVTYKSGVREMLRMLSEGKIIGILMDQDAGRDGLLVEFFNRPASTPQGPAFLARAKNAPIVAAFITENKDGTHTLVLKKPICPQQTEQKDQDILETTRHLTKIIEDHIKDHPNEWFWLHNRWKNSQ